MKPLFTQLLIIVVVATTVFFVNLGSVALWDRDEPRNAGCACEMLKRGDFVVPIFNDELRYQKPVMLYWLMISAYSVFGVNEFSARFWSAMLGLGTTLIVYAISKRLFDSTIALLASVVLATSLMFCVASRAATPDATLIFFSTLALWIYLTGTFAPRRKGQRLTLRHAACWFPRNNWMVIAMYAAMGLGTLTKGPVAFVLPTAIIGMFLLLMRLPCRTSSRDPDDGKLNAGKSSFGWTACFGMLAPIHPVHFWKTCLSMRPLTAIAVILAIAAPWFVMVDSRTDGDFTRLFFLTENFGRATNAFESHQGGLWYYPVSILIGFFPWSVFLAPVALTLVRAFQQDKTGDDDSERVPLVFLICWVGVQVGLFSLASTKLPSYVTPCYPALAVLTAFTLLSWTRKRYGVSDGWIRLSFLGLGLSGLVLCAGLGYAATAFLVGKWWLVLLGLPPVIGACFAIERLRQGSRETSVAVFAAAAILFCLLMFGFGTVAVDSSRQTDVVLTPLKMAPPGQAIAAFGCLESSWVFYSEKTIYELDCRPKASETRHNLERISNWEPKPRICPESFVAIHPQALFVTTDENLEQLKQRLPDYYEIAESADFFLKKDRKLVVLRPNGRATQFATQKDADKLR